MPSQRIVVVTGANRGLGLAVAEALAAQGEHVILTARSEEKAARAAVPLQAKGYLVTPRILDVASDESVGLFFQWLKEEHGQIDVLINNAGVIYEGHAAEPPEAPYIFGHRAGVLAKAFQNNSLSAYRTMQYALPMMNDVGSGHIVNVSSGMGALSEMGTGHPAYRVSKTALNAITILFAHEASSGVKVNAVCPGWVRTEMGGPGATRSIEEGMRGILWAANLPEDGPSGGFFRDGKVIAW